MKEVWKDISGYEGLYQVSNFGNVKSLDRIVHRKTKPDYMLKGKILKSIDNGRGYKMVCFCKNGIVKKEYVHRIVAKAFIPNSNDLPEINHRDENTSNNHADNLEWCDRKSNMNYGNRAKKFGISRGKSVICCETQKVYYSCWEAGRQTGIRHNDIWACCQGYRNKKTAGGFHWSYIDK